MKPLIPIILLLICLCGPKLRAQDIPPPNPGLAINITQGWNIQFVFDEFDEYVNGIPNTGQDTYVRIGAILDWKLEMMADADMLYGIDPSHTMELNNIGVVVDCMGTNQCSINSNLNIQNNTLVGPLALDDQAVTLLQSGTLGNKGYQAENHFILHWEMGTRQPGMHPNSILEQMLAPDTYSVIVNLILSAD
jgi:hypothetical protein